MQFILIILAACVVSAVIYYIALSEKSWRHSLPVTTSDLRKIAYLAELDENHLAKLLPLVHEIRVVKGAWIIREHEGAEALYYIVSGEVDILKRGAIDHILIQKVSAGEFIGEMALLCGTKRVASARAATTTVLIRIARIDFAEFIAADEGIKESVWSACDVHSIHLTLTDDERLRSLTANERSAWIQKRKSSFHKTGEAIPITSNSYLCLVSGAAELGNKTFLRPAMIRANAGQVLRFTADARIANLPI